MGEEESFLGFILRDSRVKYLKEWKDWKFSNKNEIYAYWKWTRRIQDSGSDEVDPQECHKKYSSIPVVVDLFTSLVAVKWCLYLSSMSIQLTVWQLHLPFTRSPSFTFISWWDWGDWLPYLPLIKRGEFIDHFVNLVPVCEESRSLYFTISTITGWWEFFFLFLNIVYLLRIHCPVRL